MKVVIYIIGGEHNEEIIGTAYDATTGINLLRAAKLLGARGVSLHGTLFEGSYPLSGEMSIAEAEKWFDLALAS